MAATTDPRVVGGVYHNGYFGFTYRVDAIAFGPRGYLDSITVTVLDTERAGSVRTHGTPWARRDRVVSTPPVGHWER